MPTPVFLPAHILLPAPQIDLTRWAVLACDQFTSQPDYWRQAEMVVDAASSTLRIILPEVYLEDDDIPTRITAIHTAMEQYKSTVLTRALQGFVYVERETSSGIRQGLVGCVDLEAYSYQPGATPRIRPSENTVVERIPPRLAVRRGAGLESPHILMLADDPDRTVIEPIAAQKERLTPLYDTQLMLKGGHIRGWAVTDAATLQAVQTALQKLEDPARYSARYGTEQGSPPFALAVGDGNHSLATAKAAWEELKPTLPPAQQAAHPARFCLVELINVQSPAIEIEPIHRVLFGATGEMVYRQLTALAGQRGAQLLPPGQPGQSFTLLADAAPMPVSLLNPWHPLAVGTVDTLLDSLLQKDPALRVDYIHGEAAVRELVAQGGAVGVLLPPFEKSDLFRGVALGGVLPRKTFSMGHATDKRYYLECRAIL